VDMEGAYYLSFACGYGYLEDMAMRIGW